LVLLSLCTSCNIGDGFADLADSVLDPDAALLERPGRKLVAGRYNNLVLDGSLEKGGYVLALRHDTPDQRLAIVPFLKGEPCEVGNALAFERLSSRVDVALSGLVAVQVSGNVGERGKIRFVGFDCAERMEALDDATLPRIEFPTNVPRGLLSLTGDKTLYLANAETKKLELVAQGVDSARVANNKLWTVEAGQLVVRDANLAEQATLGDRLLEFVVTGGTAPEVVFRDSTGLHSWSKKEGVRTITDDGCGAFATDVATISYYSPCSTRRLVVELPASKVGSKQERVRLLGPQNVVDLPNVVVAYGLTDKVTRVSFVVSADATATSGSLNVAELDPGAAGNETEITLESRSLSNDASLRAGVIYESWDGTVGDVVEMTYDGNGHADGLDLIASNVAQLPGGNAFSGRGALVRFDGNVGDLVVLDDNGKRVQETVVAKNVPIQSQALEKDGNMVAFVSELKKDAGQVVIFDGVDATVVAESAYPNTLRFLDQPNAVAYLSPGKTAGVAELHAYLTDSGLDLLVHAQVGEYRVVPWPSPGILYAVPSGKDQGLWFSKAH